MPSCKFGKPQIISRGTFVLKLYRSANRVSAIEVAILGSA
jgi:hypothetical protein